MTRDFYDELAPYYHLLYPDWDASIGRSGQSTGTLLNGNRRLQISAMTRTGIRVVAVIVALILSSKQSRFFDCNKLMGLSVLGGAAMLLILYGLVEALHGVVTSSRSQQEKLRAGGVLLVGGVAFLALAGFFTMMTHICP